MNALPDVTHSLRAPPAAVWAALVDPTARAAWRPGLTAGDTAGGSLSAGDAWVETRDVFGRPETEHVTVLEADEAAGRLVLEVDGDAGSARRGRLRFTWTLTPDGSGTRVVVAGRAHDLSRKGALLFRFLVGPYARAVQEELAGLAAWLDR